MLVNDSGSVTEANEVQPSKASSPMLINDGGNLTIANEMHSWKT